MTKFKSGERKLLFILNFFYEFDFLLLLRSRKSIRKYNSIMVLSITTKGNYLLQ